MIDNYQNTLGRPENQPPLLPPESSPSLADETGQALHNGLQQQEFNRGPVKDALMQSQENRANAMAQYERQRGAWYQSEMDRRSRMDELLLPTKIAQAQAGTAATLQGIDNAKIQAQLAQLQLTGAIARNNGYAHGFSHVSENPGDDNLPDIPEDAPPEYAQGVAQGVLQAKGLSSANAAALSTAARSNAEVADFANAHANFPAMKDWDTYQNNLPVRAAWMWKKDVGPLVKAAGASDVDFNSDPTIQGVINNPHYWEQLDPKDSSTKYLNSDGVDAIGGYLQKKGADLGQTRAESVKSASQKAQQNTREFRIRQSAINAQLSALKNDFTMKPAVKEAKRAAIDVAQQQLLADMRGDGNDDDLPADPTPAPDPGAAGDSAFHGLPTQSSAPADPDAAAILPMSKLAPDQQKAFIISSARDFAKKHPELVPQIIAKAQREYKVQLTPKDLQ